MAPDDADDDRPVPKPLAPDAAGPDPTVKELLADPALSEAVDAATARELERWFGLPSFQELAEAPPPPSDDPEMIAVRERRERALATVDPALLAWIELRTLERPETLLEFEAAIDVRIDPDVAMIDLEMVERGHLIAEPREVEISEELRDDLKDCTPQALLRDLHRPELEFDKTFEVVDMAEEQRLDIVAEVEAAMATSWALPPLGETPFAESRKLYHQLREERRRPWTELLGQLPNRRVSE